MTWFYVIVFVFGIALFVLRMIADSMVIKGCTDLVQGEVVNCETKRIHTGKRFVTEYAIWVRYRYNGQEHETESILRGELPRNIGSIVDIYVDPNNPGRQYIIDNKKGRNVATIFALIVFILIFIVPMVVMK